MKNAPTNNIPRSTYDIPPNERGFMSAAPPRIRRMFDMFEPRTLPRASCPRPLSAATTQVASSGIDVPAEYLAAGCTIDADGNVVK